LAEFSVVILAGGTSSRMGKDKALLPFRGTTMIDHILCQVEGLGKETLIIANDLEAYKHFAIPVYPDVVPGIGALGGLLSALTVAAHPHVLVLACDMPFVNQSLYRHLMSLITEYDAVMPRLNSGRREPFRSIYAKSCLEPVRAAINAGERKATSFLRFVRVRYVEEDEAKRYDPGLLTFFNINTPADLSEAEKIGAVASSKA